ncbi:hypothetical protein AgCh_035373 [Apium graveolens]
MDQIRVKKEPVGSEDPQSSARARGPEVPILGEQPTITTTVSTDYQAILFSYKTDFEEQQKKIINEAEQDGNVDVWLDKDFGLEMDETPNSHKDRIRRLVKDKLDDLVPTQVEIKNKFTKFAEQMARFDVIISLGAIMGALNIPLPALPETVRPELLAHLNLHATKTKGETKARALRASPSNNFFTYEKVLDKTINFIRVIMVVTKDGFQERKIVFNINDSGVDRVEKLEYVLDSPKPTEPANDAHNDEHVVYRKWIDDANVAQCIMLASMNIELQKQHEHMDAHTILMHLQELYDVAGRTTRYEILKELFGCRMSEGSSVNDHVLKMINLIEHLGQLGFVMDGDLSQDLVLQSLSDCGIEFSPKKSSLLLIGEGSNPKKRKKNPSKKKKVGEKKPVPPKAEDPKSKVVCFHCNKVAHWRRNCKVYLAELKKKKGSETTASVSDLVILVKIDCGHCIRKGYLTPFDFESYPTCESCLLGKMTKSPFNGHGERAADLLGLVHTDVCGPMSTQAMGGFSYFITFIDDRSRFEYVYLMKHKSEAFEKFKEYKYEVEKQTKHSIITLRSDRGGEYLNGEFLDYLKENGIVSQWTPPYTPQLNGVSERRNRTLLDMVRSMMSYANLPVFLWGYALETSAYLLNKPIRRSGRVSLQPERYYGLVIENDNELSIIDDDDPVTYNEAMSSVDSEK